MLVLKSQSFLALKLSWEVEEEAGEIFEIWEYLEGLS
jgi:hypothetical protein